MEQIIVTKKDGTKILLNSHKNNSVITSAIHRVQFQSYDYLEIRVRSLNSLNFGIGDTVTISGNVFTLNQLPEVDKSNNVLEYSLTFESCKYDLINVIFLLHNNNAKGDDFTGTLYDFADLIVWNLNRIYSGKWTINFKDLTAAKKTAVKTLNLVGNNCLAALQSICETYNYEFSITESNNLKTIEIRKQNTGNTFDYTFEYGKGKGLYHIRRAAINDNNIITRLYGYGADISSELNYRNGRICLPEKHKEDSYIEDSDAVKLYGIREGMKTYDEIKPEISGKIDSIVDIQTFVCQTLPDFNETWGIVPTEAYNSPEFLEWLRCMGFLPTDWQTFTNEQLEKYLTQYRSSVQGKKKFGNTPSITFTSGLLMGFSFEVSAFDSSTKQVKLKQIREITDYGTVNYPSATDRAYQFAAGDEFVVSDINLTLPYIIDSEHQVLQALQNDLKNVCRPLATYQIYITEGFIYRHYNQEADLFQAGDFLKILDTSIGLNTPTSIKIEAYNRDLLNPCKYEVTISDIKENYSISKDSFGKYDRDRMYFDDFTSGGFDETKDYNCSCQLSANYTGDYNKLHISSGIFSIRLNGNTYQWNIAETVLEYKNSDTFHVADNEIIPIKLRFTTKNIVNSFQATKNLPYTKPVLLDFDTDGIAEFVLTESQTDLTTTYTLGLHKYKGGTLGHFILGYLSEVKNDNGIKSRQLVLMDGVNFYTAYDITSGKFRNQDGDVLDLDTGKGNFKDTTITGGKFRDLNGDVIVVDLNDRKANFDDFTAETGTMKGGTIKHGDVTVIDIDNKGGFFDNFTTESGTIKGGTIKKGNVVIIDIDNKRGYFPELSSDKAVLSRTKIVQYGEDGQAKTLFDFEEGKFVDLATNNNLFTIADNTIKFKRLTFEDDNGAEIDLLRETSTQRDAISKRVLTTTFNTFKSGEFTTVKNQSTNNNAEITTIKGEVFDDDNSSKLTKIISKIDDELIPAAAQLDYNIQQLSSNGCGSVFGKLNSAFQRLAEAIGDQDFSAAEEILNNDCQVKYSFTDIPSCIPGKDYNAGVKPMDNITPLYPTTTS